MGRKIAWMAVQTSDEDALLRSIGLEVIGEANDELNVQRAMARLPNGWLIIAHAGFKISFEAEARMVSASAEAFAGEVYENVMASGLRAYRKGTMDWSVIHDPDADPPLRIEGRLPSALQQVRAKLEAEEDEHIEFETPIRLAAELTDFDAFRGVDTVWSVLAPIGSTKAGTDVGAPRLSALIEDELVAQLLGRGWRPLSAAERPKVWAPKGAFELYRRVGGAVHVVNFTFWEADEVCVDINYFVADETYVGVDPIIAGSVPPPEASLLKRVFSFGKPSTREDRRRAAIEDAKARLAALQTFLDGEAMDRRIRLDGGLAKHCWPAMPPRAHQ